MKSVLLLLLTAQALAQTGPAVAELAAFDQAVSQLITQYQLPGAALAVAKDGRLVYTRGFGLADRETGERTQPDSLFRIASVSKPLTAVATLKLVEDGKLTLDTRVLALLGRRARLDPRWNDVTVRHLLEHTGGLDPEFWEFDPTFPDRETLDALGANLPPTRADIIGFVLENLPLASAPGRQFGYSNMGFLFLTEVIEKASGQRYEAYVREKIFAPLGITRMRIAGTLLTERLAGEVRYWDQGRTSLPIFPGLPEATENPYGAFNLRIFESGGGWLASMPDLVRFLAAFDGPTSILRPETVRLMTQRPAYEPSTATTWYGLGWEVNTLPAGLRWGHTGGMPGTSAWMFRGPNGVSVAIASNHLPDDGVLVAFFRDLEAGLTRAANSITRWPTGDTFATFLPARAPRIAEAGVVNAATLRQGTVAAGSIVRIVGTNLERGPNLQRGIVRINGAVADTLWTDAGDPHVRVPLSARGPVQFQVDLDGLSSNLVTIPVEPAAPGIFTLSRNGYGPAAALNQNLSLNSASRPAPAGSVVAFYATGVAPAAEVTLNGLLAEVLYSGPAPGLPAGLLQLNVRIPPSLTPGPASLRIRSGGALSLNGVTLAIE